MRYSIILFLLFSTLFAGEPMNEPCTIFDKQDAIKSVKEGQIFERSIHLFHAIFDYQEGLLFSTKIDGSLVSNLELEIENSIGAFLKQATPWAGFTGEEGVQFNAQDGTTDYTWFLDPIDGTISFCNGLDTFAFTLTLTHKSEAIATVIYIPRMNKTYKAFKSHGATLNDHPIKMKRTVTGPKSVFAVSDDYTFAMTERSEVLKHLRTLPYITRNITDIYGYCMVAEGKCIGKFDAAGALWDLSPGYLLIQEAGGKCLYFPMPQPTDDLAGSMLIGEAAFVDDVYQYLRNKIDVKTLPVPLETL